VFERWKYLMPNFSLRMSNLAAALLRPQLRLLAQRAQTWNLLYAKLAGVLGSVPRLRLPLRSPNEQYVASSIQFNLDLNRAGIERFLHECALRGLHIKWFGRSERSASRAISSTGTTCSKRRCWAGRRRCWRGCATCASRCRCR